MQGPLGSERIEPLNRTKTTGLRNYHSENDHDHDSCIIQGSAYNKFEIISTWSTRRTWAPDICWKSIQVPLSFWLFFWPEVLSWAETYFLTCTLTLLEFINLIVCWSLYIEQRLLSNTCYQLQVPLIPFGLKLTTLFTQNVKNLFFCFFFFVISKRGMVKCAIGHFNT